MEIVAPVTDYVPDSILTTQGDLIKRGVADAERLALGSAGDILRVNGAGNDLAYEEPGKHWADEDYSADNSGLVTITNSATTVATVDLGTVTAGDLIYTDGRIFATKGGTAGMCITYIYKDSGTATISTYKDKITLDQTSYIVASYQFRLSVSGIIRVTGSGTLVLRLAGLSEGSNSSCNANNGQILAMIIRKQ